MEIEGDGTTMVLTGGRSLGGFQQAANIFRGIPDRSVDMESG
jgi:hypothetical protein